jgi:hypothetical protein
MEIVSCIEDGCNLPMEHPKSGRCTPCYQRHRIARIQDGCIVDGCTRKATHKTPLMCEPCYQRNRISQITDPCSTPGCDGIVAIKDSQLCYACYRQLQKTRQTEKCSTDGCERPVSGAGSVLCTLCMEYARLSKLGPCRFEECDKQIRNQGTGLCSGHYQQHKKGMPLRPLRRAKGTGSINPDGYIILTRSKRTRGEHIWVMEEIIGRELFPDETVHHRNGLRSDNRPSNLELHASSHARGQTIPDLLAWAHEIIDRYEPA